MMVAAEDVVALRAIVAQLANSWNSADGTAFAALFTEDAVFVDMKANRDEGRVAIAARHVWLFETVFKDTRIAYDLVDAATVADGLALGHIRAHVRLAAGTIETLATCMFRRLDEGWRLSMFQNTQIGDFTDGLFKEPAIPAATPVLQQDHLAKGIEPPGSQPFVHTRDDAPAFWSQDILWLILASAEETDRRWSMMEELCPRGSGAPPHVHTFSDETFYVIDGAISFLIGEDIKPVSAGAFVVVPRSTVHGFRVDSETARILNAYTPASWETAVVGMAEAAPTRELPPPGRPTPGRKQAMAYMKAFGMEPVAGPDPLRPGEPPMS